MNQYENYYGPIYIPENEAKGKCGVRTKHGGKDFIKSFNSKAMHSTKSLVMQAGINLLKKENHHVPEIDIRRSIT